MIPPRSVLLLAFCLAPACSDGAEPGVSEAPRPAAGPADEEAPEPTRTLQKGGVRIEVLEEGTGPRARTGDWVTVHYVGRLADAETPFGDTRKSGVPYSTWLRSTKVIPGWKRGIDGLRVGTRAVLHIPSRLAYGERGLPEARIPPGADLVYEIEIMNAVDRPNRR